MLRAVLLLLSLLATSPALAQAVAFAQAPEQSSGTGFADTIEGAISAAVAHCVEGGASEQDCQITAACSYAGWSIDLFVQHNEGIHWHEIYCGIPDETTARAMAEAACKMENRPYLIECALVQLWNVQTPMMEW